MYPRLHICKDAIAQNVRVVTGLCAEHGIGVTGITKVFRGDPEIARIFAENGVCGLGDSRIENLRRLEGIEIEKWLIRMPGISQAEDAVRCCDVSLNSANETILALSRACEKLGMTHKVVLMYDLGDLREGYIDREEIAAAAELVRSCPRLELAGVGTNLTCFNFVHPDTEKLSELVQVGREIGAGTYVSGGNSATLDLMLRGGIPEGVNLLRLGESLLFGRGRACYRYLEGTRNDAFQLEAEIIELREKPSMPWGEFGVDSYGRAPEHHDRGIRKRAICALGRQDADFETLWPMDPGVEILGASSDHLMLDVTEAEGTYRVGDTVRFRLGYFALMRAYTSDYVEKCYIL
ncbi:MAG: alanine/ornithine racemase family PLP-dependent enzyme [Clostridiales bacterium]|nr:alanine/ornithine racemase family PLP-dependent enzyme [Clostridiales bacterium]